MKQTDRVIIDAVIQKAEAVCPDSLALIGVYGSVATGDTHEKSDLDLMILINDDRGWQLARAFILDDTGVGYDIYCTSWEMLEEEARCEHAQLAKLMDSKLVYVRDQRAVERLEALRQKARALLASGERYGRAQAAYENAKKGFADCLLAESMDKIRLTAGWVISCLMDAVMLHHGRYFHKGTKRAFEELAQLPLSFDMQQLVMAVVQAEEADDLRAGLTALMRRVGESLQRPAVKTAPGPENLAGTYEEMYSNWRNKMHEAARCGDVYASFMNMGFFSFMLDGIAREVAVGERTVMDRFDPRRLEQNAEAFDAVLEDYLQEYRKAGIRPERYRDAEAFAADYLKGKDGPVG